MEIDIRDDSLIVNGETIAEALEVEVLKRALGEPRVQKTEPDKNYRAYMEGRRGKDYFDNCMALVWDELGVYSRSNDGKTLAAIGVVFDNSSKTALHTPKANYSGTLTINGVEWLAAVKEGKDMFGNYCKVALKSFVVFAEYTPGKKPLPERTAKDFTLIEINHAY